MAENSSKRPGLYICVAIICFLLAVGMAAALVYVVAFDDEDSDSESESVTLQLITRDSSLTYTGNMANPTSSDFKNVENAHCSEVEEALDGSNCQVLSLTKGSVIIESVVEVKKKASQAMADLLTEVKGNLGRNGVNVQHTGLAVGMCKSTTCQNGGVCVAVTRNQGICQCAKNFEGIVCADEAAAGCLDSEFGCDGRCFNQSLWCDGTDDCSSGMDERPGCNDTCAPNQHQCIHDEGHCLDPALLCDTEVDCYDWSDELNCPPCDDIANITQCIDPPVCLDPFMWCTGVEYCLDGSDNPEGCECRDYQFDCSDGPVKCIPYFLVCDREAHCADKSDELSCDCYELENRCNNGLCMNAKAWCDGIDDCGDLSDELGCECTQNQTQCDDGLTCFNKGQWCDKYPNCQDGSDEKEGCTCNEEQFACDGFCRPNSQKCDGTKDCVDATDEDCGCSGFQCGESLECLPEDNKCDGFPQCADRSDEENCEDVCSSNQFTCDNGRCIESNFVCDQHDNCGDDSDEKSCDYQCLDEEYKCARGNCIPRVWLCDLIADCDDADDEDQEHCVNCNADQRPCRGGKTCIAPDQHCDGIEQCPYGEDEHQCVRLDKDSAQAGEALVVKATMDDVAYDGICSDNWSEAWTTAVCTYLSYESGESHEFIDAAVEASLLVPKSSDPFPGQLLNGLSTGNCGSGKMVSVKCLSKECGTVPVHSNDFSPYIIHGEEAAPGQWPWQIQLLNTGAFYCGGSIIDHYWILTAAHCVSSDFSHPLHASSFTIRAGTNRLGVPDPNSRVYKVDKIIVHPAYDAANIVNDIALMRVTESIEYSDFIRPVCVAGSSYDPKEAVECYISGWGVDTVEYDVASPLLQQAKMDILTAEYCDQVFQEGAGTKWQREKLHVRDATEICLGFPPKPIDSCYGDSGGPLMCRDQYFHWTVAGVTSWGPYCKSFSAYTRVSHYSEWVALKMAENPPMN